MTGSPPEYHIPVLLLEAMDGLKIRQDGVYVDCTFGGGGHSAQILSTLNISGRLYAFDQDPDAKRNALPDERFKLIPHNFRHLQRFLRLEGIDKVDGILADLGVSSHQFNEADRGFSTRADADLDMRMDKRQPVTAATILNSFTEEQLHKMFEQYGEVTNSKTLAKAIAGLRPATVFRTINGFLQATSHLVKGNPNRYYAQVFQALRIAVNDEFESLREMLLQATDLLKPGGRLAVISFHSLEDRIVKHYFQKQSFTEQDDSNPFETTTTNKKLRIVTKKPITPSEEELKRNPRSRSAKLRVAEKN